MTKTLLILSLLLAFGTVKAQDENDATEKETQDWINTFGFTEVILANDNQSNINVSFYYGLVEFSYTDIRIKGFKGDFLPLRNKEITEKVFKAFCHYIKLKDLDIKTNNKLSLENKF